jgi:two-component system OmpR family sensor kinase
VLLAWFVGRRITGSAIEPLVDVTKALRRIADGDFAPAPLLHHSLELRDLTSAYDDVAYRLSAATAERLRYETEMRQFIADAGHELRTPLTIVMGYLEALQGGVVRDTDGISRVYETMQGESRRMKTVIEKLIFLARLEKAVRSTTQQLDLAAVTQRAIEALLPLGGDRVSFERDGAVTIDADESELYEAIKNIIENALKYAPGSPVTVTLQRDASGASLDVRDRGPGMNDDDVAHAFDRFYRGEARTTAEGSGLGLAIAKRAVERVGGTIAIASTPGTGTTVTLHFA